MRPKKRYKILIAILSCILFVACTQEQKTKGTETESKENFLAKSTLKIPKKGKLQSLNPIQKKLVQDWLPFNTVHENMKLINQSSRFAIIEDLGQLAANIDTLELGKKPEKLDIMQIRSRFLVLKTKALKLQDDASDDAATNEFIEQQIVEMNKVFNTICFQIEQVTKRDMKPEEILGDIFKTQDSLNPTTEKGLINTKTPVKKTVKVPSGKKIFKKQELKSQKN